MEKVTLNIEINSKSRKDGLSGIMIRLTQNRKMKRISTDVFTKKTDFNSKAKRGKWVKPTDPQYDEKNELLLNHLQRFESTISTIKLHRLGLTISNVLSYSESSIYDVMSYWELEIQRYYNSAKYASYKNHCCSKNKLNSYLNGKRLDFNELTVPFLKKYETRLIKQGCSTNSISAYMSNLRTIVNKAINDKILIHSNNPFLYYKLKIEKSRKIKLTSSEIKKIEELDLKPDTEIWHARNSFMFSYYMAGMRFSDVMTCKHKNINDNRLIYSTRKTKVPISLNIHKNAQKILSYYYDNYSPKESFVFPYLKDKPLHDMRIKRELENANTKINYYLGKIAKLAGINKRLTFHIARHSFANIGRIKTNNDIYAICKALGQNNIETTKIYLEELKDDELDATMGMIFGE